MLCTKCNNEIPKKEKRCPNCGSAVVKQTKPLYPIVMIGIIISFVGGFLPAIQSSTLGGSVYGLLSLEKPYLWYAFTLLCAVSFILCACKYEKYSIASTVLALGLYYYGYSVVCAKFGAKGMEMGIGLYVVIAGTVIGVAGAFINVLKNKTNKKTTPIFPIAIAGSVISFFGAFFPAIQNSNAVKRFNPAYGLMNYEEPYIWYLFMILCTFSIVLCACKMEKLSIETTILACIVYYYSYSTTCARHGAKGMENGLGLYLVIAGTVIGIAGAFLNVLKNAEAKKRKRGQLDYMYTGNKSVGQRIIEYRWFYVMFLPVLIFIIVFNYLPMLGLRYAFTEYKSGQEATYVGIRNFVDMFGLTELSKLKSAQFLRAFGNTLVLSIVKLVLNTSMAVIISLLLNEIVNIHFKKTVQTIIYLPHFMSWVVVASIFKMILSASSTGVLNSFLVDVGIIDTPINFLTTESSWTVVYYIVNIWKDTGWGTILFLATLSGISPDLYEAASIDGAGRWAKMRYITFPALENTIITVFILNLAKVMNLFESVFVMYNPSVYNVSDVIQTYIYRETFGSGAANYGYTTAVGLFKSLVGCVLVLICNKASKRVRGRGIV